MVHYGLFGIKTIRHDSVCPDDGAHGWFAFYDGGEPSESNSLHSYSGVQLGGDTAHNEYRCYTGDGTDGYQHAGGDFASAPAGVQVTPASGTLTAGSSLTFVVSAAPNCTGVTAGPTTLTFEQGGGQTSDAIGGAHTCRAGNYHLGAYGYAQFG